MTRSIRLARGSRATLVLLGFVSLAALLAPASATAGRLAKRSAAELQRVAAELDQLAESPEAAAAEGEIEVGRQWVEDGRAALRERRNRDAALIAERLPLQLRLIRAVLAAATIEAEAEKLERECAALEKRLVVTRSSYDRLVLRYDGARLSGAFPRKGSTP